MKANDLIGLDPQLWRAAPEHAFHEQAVRKTADVRGDD